MNERKSELGRTKNKICEDEGSDEVSAAAVCGDPSQQQIA